MNCNFCNLPLDIDSPNLNQIVIPNIAKYAKTIEGVAKLEATKVQNFCNSFCLYLHALRYILDIKDVVGFSPDLVEGIRIVMLESVQQYFNNAEKTQERLDKFRKDILKDY